MSWATLRDGRLRIELRVQPGAKRQGVKGIETDAAGVSRLAVRVNAPPVGGKANQAVVRLLARRWGIAASRLSLVKGAAARGKCVEIADGDAQLLDKIVGIEHIVT